MLDRSWSEGAGRQDTLLVMVSPFEDEPGCDKLPHPQDGRLPKSLEPGGFRAATARHRICKSEDRVPTSLSLVSGFVSIAIDVSCVFHSSPESPRRAKTAEEGLVMYGFVISRSPVQARRVAPCPQLPTRLIRPKFPFFRQPYPPT